MWRRAKRIAGWSESLSPTVFSTDSGLISKPKQMADHLNNFFCSKIQNICDSLALKTPSDPPVLPVPHAVCSPRQSPQSISLSNSPNTFLGVFPFFVVFDSTRFVYFDRS